MKILSILFKVGTGKGNSMTFRFTFTWKWHQARQIIRIRNAIKCRRLRWTQTAAAQRFKSILHLSSNFVVGFSSSIARPMPIKDLISMRRKCTRRRICMESETIQFCSIFLFFLPESELRNFELLPKYSVVTNTFRPTDTQSAQWVHSIYRASFKSRSMCYRHFFTCGWHSWFNYIFRLSLLEIRNSMFSFFMFRGLLGRRGQFARLFPLYDSNPSNDEAFTRINGETHSALRF